MAEDRIDLTIIKDKFFSLELGKKDSWSIKNSPSSLSIKEEVLIEKINLEYEGKRFYPSGVVLNNRGEMFLSDKDNHRIIQVKDDAHGNTILTVFYTDNNNLAFSSITTSKGTSWKLYQHSRLIIEREKVG